jgi:hypothetical protein
MPFIGLLFKLFVMVVNTALMIGLNIFLDSLSVAARLDARDSD